MDKNNPYGEILDTGEVAKLLRCSSSKLNQDRSKGVGITYIKVGRLVKYRFSDVQAWLEAQKVVPYRENN